ncbi:MAG TPA: hypothetical protein VJU81_07110 [Methylomirabilota bacterium]|nr:hypothetical protein [Methylomirabilota bacterium]
MARSPVIALLALSLLAGCATSDTLESRGPGVSLRPPSDVARQLVGRWGADCKVVFSGVGVSGRVVGWGADGAPLVGQFQERPGSAGAAGSLTFPWPVAVVEIPSPLPLSAAGVTGGALVYTFYPADGRLRLTGPQPRWPNAGYPVPVSFDLHRCSGPEQAPRDWHPIG